MKRIVLACFILIVILFTSLASAATPGAYVTLRGLIVEDQYQVFFRVAAGTDAGKVYRLGGPMQLDFEQLVGQELLVTGQKYLLDGRSYYGWINVTQYSVKTEGYIFGVLRETAAGLRLLSGMMVYQIPEGEFATKLKKHADYKILIKGTALPIGNFKALLEIKDFCVVGEEPVIIKDPIYQYEKNLSESKE